MRDFWLSFVSQEPALVFFFNQYWSIASNGEGNAHVTHGLIDGRYGLDYPAGILQEGKCSKY